MRESFLYGPNFDRNIYRVVETQNWASLPTRRINTDNTRV